MDLPASTTMWANSSKPIYLDRSIDTHRCTVYRGICTHRSRLSVSREKPNMLTVLCALLLPPSFCACADLFLPLYSASFVYFSTPFQLYYYLISGRITLPCNSSSKLILDLLFSHVNFDLLDNFIKNPAQIFLKLLWICWLMWWE